MREGYIPKDQRKKILLLSDDLRMPSGVGVMSKEIVLGTAHRYNWAHLGAAVNHPERGKIIDASPWVAKDTGVEDAYLRIYPNAGYGDASTLRTLIEMEKPDAVLHFTDPRYWIWLYQMEHEIRQKMPIMFYHVWDDLPFPKYNENYYRSCDFIATISKQTHNIVRNVWKKDAPEPWQVKYIPHGINPQSFYPLTDEAEKAELVEVRKKMFRGEDVDFVVLYNNRNIRRKNTSDVIMAYREFFLSLTPEQQKKARLVLRTDPVDEHGTDLPRVIRDCAPEITVIFVAERVDTKTLNQLYNVSDVVINLASAEGFGLGTAEALMAGRMIVANVTGGLQDQMGFVDENGDFLHEEKHYNAEWGTNADGRYRQYGPWVRPVFPNNRSLIGTPPTPYIYEDRCSTHDAAKAIRQVYDLDPVSRMLMGQLGREYMLTQGFTSGEMCRRFIDGIDTTLEQWKPAKRFHMIKV